MNGLRILLIGGVLSYRALFNWRHPAVYIPTMLVAPVFQIVYFTFLGRYSGVADDRYFIVGGAVQASATAGVFGMVMALANEREFGTLACVLATPAGRGPLFFGRTLPMVAGGVLVSSVVLGAGFAGLGLRMPVAALPGLAAAVVVTAASAAMFGLALGAVGMRVRDLWVGSNLAYSLTFLLCGSTVPPAALPGWLAAAGRALPLTHGIEAARAFATGASGGGRQLIWEALVGLGYAVLGYALLRLFELESRHRASLDER